MIRNSLYNALCARLSECLPTVQHIALWNHNIEFASQEQEWKCPAVFVEFESVPWTPLKESRFFRGSSRVLLHVVTDAHNTASPPFQTADAVRNAVALLSGPDFSPLLPVETLTNHNHEELIESIEVFAVRYTLNLTPSNAE